MSLDSAVAKWRKPGSKWRQTFLLDPSNAVLGSWLDEQEEPWGIGCKACCSAGCAGGLAQYSVMTEHGLQKINFEKHAKSQSHQEAVRRYLLAAVSAAAGSTSTTVAPGASPNQAAFEDVWEGVMKGDPLNGQKNVLMVFCLAEAMKSSDQKRLARAAEIGLFRDERKGRILLRYRAVTEELEMWSGMMGQERDAGTGAQNLTKATEKIVIKAFLQSMNWRRKRQAKAIFEDRLVASCAW